MDTYRECPEKVFENNLILVPQETQNLITGDQWELYTDAVELCGMCPILRYRINVKFIKMLQVNLRFHRFMENLSPYFSEKNDIEVLPPLYVLNYLQDSGIAFYVSCLHCRTMYEVQT